MHKQKRPCECGHKAGKHDFSKRRVLYNPFKSGRMTMPHKLRKHIGFCHADGCTCRAYKERPRQEPPRAKVAPTIKVSK